MSLSQGSNKNRSEYLNIFDKTNQISSQGEINYFVDTFLSIVLTGQENILENLFNKDEKTIMKIMAQEYYFDSSRDGVGVKELKEVFSYSDNTIRNKLKELHDKDLIYKVKGRPVKYILSKNYLENRY